MVTVTHTDGVELMVGNEVRTIGPLVERFVWRESLIRGGLSWEMRIKANVWEEWNNILLGRPKPAVKARVTSQEEGEEVTTEWRTFLVDGSKSMYRGQTLIADIWGADRRLDLMQFHRFRAWPQSTVAEIVRVIAGENGLVATADETRVRQDRWQVQETDWAFMHRQVYETASESGRGDLFLRLDEGRLLLSAPVLGRPGERRHDMDEVENRVDSVVLSYYGREVDRAGGATLRGIGWDWDAKQALTFELGANQAQTHASLASRVPREQEKGLRILPVTEATPDAVEARTRGRWGRFAPRYFGLKVVTRPDLLLRPGNMLELQATIDRDQETPLLGRFLVLEVQHELAKGAINTTAVCYRREAFEGEEQPTGSSAENVKARDEYRLNRMQKQRVILRAEVIT